MSVISSRQNNILAARKHQLTLNMLAWHGGSPYIDARLWRAPNESDLSWHGTAPLSSKPSYYSAGRKDRAALINDAGRVVNKITQYLFKTATERDGIDHDWSSDVTGTGVNVTNLWVYVSELLTTGQWCWLQVDRLGPILDAETGKTRPRTLLEKKRDNDRIRWTAWPSTSVPDWSFAADGSLAWVITEGVAINNDNPFTEAKKQVIRTLWRMLEGRVHVTQIIDGNTGQEVATELRTMPFVVVGTPSTDPWWFDDVEMLQAHLLNLDSLHYENLVRSVFPQLVLPRSTLENLEMKLVERIGAANGERMVEVVREIVRGLDAPIIEAAEESGIARFIQPSATEQQTLPSEMQRKRALLFDNAGLALFNKEVRQIQTAESKQFDQLDTESTLQFRAQLMQSTEQKMVELSKEIDPTFTVYNPVWPTSFDVTDIESDTAALTMLGNIPDVTPAMRKLVLLGALRILAQKWGHEKELLAQARDEIEAMTFDTFDEDLEPEFDE